MSAGLTIATDHNFEVESFQETTPLNVGEVSRSFNGTFRSSVRSQKRTFQAVTMPYGKSTYDALAAHIANDTSVAVTGNCLVGASLTCVVRATYDLVGIGTAEDGYTFLYKITLKIEEV